MSEEKEKIKIDILYQVGRIQDCINRIEELERNMEEQGLWNQDLLKTLEITGDFRINPDYTYHIPDKVRTLFKWMTNFNRLFKRVYLEPVVQPEIDLWEKNTVTVTCPFCHQGYYLAPRKIEEKTKNKLIAKFLEKFKQIRKDLRDENYDEIMLGIDVIIEDLKKRQKDESR